MNGHKFDHPPLLAPGRHIMTLAEIETLCVHRFTGTARSKRERLFYGLEELIQNLLQVRLRCSIFIDGSFLTEKQHPDDVDVLVNIDLDVMTNLTSEQRVLVDAINQLQYIVNIDSWAATSYPRGHRNFGTALDIGNAGDAYGIEHSKLWLKGIAVLKLGETDVGLRICR